MCDIGWCWYEWTWFRRTVCRRGRGGCLLLHRCERVPCEWIYDAARCFILTQYLKFILSDVERSDIEYMSLFQTKHIKQEQGKRKYDDAFIYSLVMRRRLGKANWSLLNSRCELLLHLSINCPLITPSSHQDPSALTHPSSSPSSSPASAQLSDIIFGTALVAALPCNTQRKVPLLFPRYGPVISLPQNRGRLRRLLQGRVAQRLLLPDNGEEVCQGVRGGETERRRVWELCAGLPGVVVVVLHCNITERTPLEGIWGQEEMNVTLHANSYRKC